MGNVFRSEVEWQAFLADQVERHGALLYKLAYGVLRDAAAAEDICQQAVLKALRKSDELRGADTLQAWLARVVMNESISLCRRRKVEKQALSGRVAPAVSRGTEGGDWEVREAVLEAVENLPEPPRTVIILRMLEGMSGGDVSQTLDCSASYVSRQLHAGLELLREVLQDWKSAVSKENTR
jgi:RNA polymerase sigma-70 factor (ECF subfamily)